MHERMNVALFMARQVVSLFAGDRTRCACAEDALGSARRVRRRQVWATSSR